MKNLKYSTLYVLLLLVGFWSCQEDDELVTPVPEPEEEALMAPSATDLLDTTYSLMQSIYLWNNEVPDVDLQDYATAEALIQDLRVELDKWSYITEEETYNSYFQRGEYEGYGYGHAFGQEGNLRVSLVYQDSPFGRAGVDRGWIISKINGTTITPDTYSSDLIEAATNTFEFVNLAGEVVTETLTKSTIAINTVLQYDIIETNNQPVGYLAFNGFIDNSIDELKPVLEAFQQAGISDLVLDLRYNGGGKVFVAEYLASNIIGSRGANRTFMQYAFNPDVQADIDADPEKKAQLTTKFKAPEFPLDLDRLIILASDRTASASELLINGLNPFIDVLIVGENTHGKPVGSRAFRYGGYAISPISFRLTNDNGEGDYFGGFAPDAFVEDDLSRPFGDPEEARLKEALYFIETGAFSTGGARTAPITTDKYDMGLTGFQREIGTL